VRALLTAFSFLTIIPVPTRPELAPGELGRAAAWFPAAGLVIGLILAGVDWCGAALWGSLVASALILGAALLVTGGLHIDGLIDAADAFFGRRDREGMLAIMKDSRAGALGVASGICLLVIKFAAYASLSGADRWRLIAAAPVLGRMAMVMGLAWFPYARSAGTGLGFADQTRGRHAVVAVTVAAAAAFALLSLRGLVLTAGAALVAALCAAYWQRRLGGLTGDIYGAINEVVEVMVLLSASAAPWR